VVKLGADGQAPAEQRPEWDFSTREGWEKYWTLLQAAFRCAVAICVQGHSITSINTATNASVLTPLLLARVHKCTFKPWHLHARQASHAVQALCRIHVVTVIELFSAGAIYCDVDIVWLTPV
jgi:hypothetical protein